MFEFCFIRLSDASSLWTNCSSLTEDVGWIAPTSNLSTFQENCYYFGTNTTFVWNNAFQHCISIGGQLAIIETNAEYQWILSVWSGTYSSITKIFLDTQAGRYGPSMYEYMSHTSINVLSLKCSVYCLVRFEIEKD